MVNAHTKNMLNAIRGDAERPAELRNHDILELMRGEGWTLKENTEGLAVFEREKIFDARQVLLVPALGVLILVLSFNGLLPRMAPASLLPIAAAVATCWPVFYTAYYCLTFRTDREIQKVRLVSA